MFQTNSHEVGLQTDDHQPIPTDLTTDQFAAWVDIDADISLSLGLTVKEEEQEMRNI